jgi:hypothetical protein
MPLMADLRVCASTSCSIEGTRAASLRACPSGGLRTLEDSAFDCAFRYASTRLSSAWRRRSPFDLPYWATCLPSFSISSEPTRLR